MFLQDVCHNLSMITIDFSLAYSISFYIKGGYPMPKKTQKTQYGSLSQILFLLCLLSLVSAFPKIAISEEKLEVRQKEGQAKVQETLSNEKDSKGDTDWTGLFVKQVDKWLAEISKTDSRFKHWSTVKWESYPFGPGSKQWMVILLRDNQEIGYLIVGVNASEQLILIEYGQSEHVSLLHVIQDETTPFIYSGLLWAVVDEGMLVDIITRERYEHVDLKEVEPYWSGESVQKINQFYTCLGELDVDSAIVHYGNKLNNKKIGSNKLQDTQDKSINKLISIQRDTTKKNQPLFYKAEILPKVRGLYQVESIHTWATLGKNRELDETYYFGLRDGGLRFLSYKYLLSLNGSFY
jgi:hypothetical protein